MATAIFESAADSRGETDEQERLHVQRSAANPAPLLAS